MKKVFIIHGFEGEPNGGWIPWLMGELKKEGIYACALPMPDPNEPKKDEWVKTLTDFVGIPTPDIVLVGHSLGVPAILRYLETISNGNILRSVLVGGPHEPLRIEQKDSNLRKVDHFINTPFNFDIIKNSCLHFSIIHGDNDYCVPFDHAKYFAKNLGCSVISISNGKHLSGDDGIYQLPEALEEVLKMISLDPIR